MLMITRHDGRFLEMIFFLGFCFVGSYVDEESDKELVFLCAATCS
jgi:hypothetical protein